MASCGQLFRNPFTAGLLLVPEEPVYRVSGDLVETRRRVSNEIASLVVGQDGSTLWEVLRMLNWVAAPSTQHSAARTPWGAKWIHVFGFADLDGPLKIGPDFREAVGIDDGYIPEFLELRVPRTDATEVQGIADALQNAFSPAVPSPDRRWRARRFVQFVLPSISKMDLKLFSDARAAYEREDKDQRTLDHSLLLEQGLVLSEPSTRLPGMAGESREGSDSWVAVSLQDLLGAPVSTSEKAAVAE